MNILRTVILDLLYPPKCALCRKLLTARETDFCTACRLAMPDTPPDDRHGEFFSRCIVSQPYEGKVRDAFLRFKFGGLTAYATPFGRLLAMRLLEARAEYDLISWVPISAKRRRTRGYDQTELLARVVARELGAVLTPTLKKIRENPPQTTKESAAERRANVINCYCVQNAALLRGKRILLIDDICTTGSTLSECSRVLQTAGAASVLAAAFAAPERDAAGK